MRGGNVRIIRDWSLRRCPMLSVFKAKGLGDGGGKKVVVKWYG